MQKSLQACTHYSYVNTICKSMPPTHTPSYVYKCDSYTQHAFVRAHQAQLLATHACACQRAACQIHGQRRLPFFFLALGFLCD